jgi:acetamidase/formamidase/AraC-like DNA-binding protein
MALTEFSTDPFPLDRRRAVWADALHPLGLDVADTEALYGRLLRHSAPRGADIVLIVGGPQCLLRRPGAGDGPGWLGLLLEGPLPEAASVSRRELLYWPAGPGTLLRSSSRFKLLLIGVSRHDPSWDELPAAEEGKDEPVRLRQPVLCALLAAIGEAMEAAEPAALAALTLAWAELMPAALARLAGGRAQRTAFRRRILQALDRHLEDPHLNLARFAAAESISSRAVQKLLQDEGHSFSQHLRQRRLERAAEALADPQQASVSIAEIGFRCGFADPAHFSRAFRHQYGLVPSVYRLQAQTSAADALPQAQRIRGHPGPVARREAQPLRAVCLPTASRSDAPAHHHLRATPGTVHWGYFSRSLTPALTVRSGDTVTVDTLTQHASDDPARMIAGDLDAEAVFHWTPERKAIDRRGAGPVDASVYGRGAGEGFGVHILTGPIMVEEARPGDILEVDILDIELRPSQAPGFAGRCFGSNAAAWWGQHYDELLTGPKPREVVTIYEIADIDGHPYAQAAYSYRWTPQRDPSGILHETIDYPGVPVDPATIAPQSGVLRGIRIPVRPHFGTIGLASDHPVPLDSVPPSAFGGNIDNWRLGAGSKLFLPVALAGAMLSLGDPHAAQGDGEVAGTAIECSLTGTLRLRVHPRETLGPMLRDLTYPLIETPESWVVQGFSHPDYLREFGSAAQSEVYKQSSLDGAMRDAFRKARRFLMTAKGLTEDEAISLLSVAVDFGITQVVDGNWGVHAGIPKAMFPR